jgi:hypothetical protein
MDTLFQIRLQITLQSRWFVSGFFFKVRASLSRTTMSRHSFDPSNFAQNQPQPLGRGVRPNAENEAYTNHRTYPSDFYLPYFR